MQQSKCNTGTYARVPVGCQFGQAKRKWFLELGGMVCCCSVLLLGNLDCRRGVWGCINVRYNYFYDLVPPSVFTVLCIDILTIV